jgi:hypothetical protein
MAILAQVQRHRQLQQHAIEQRQAKGWARDRNWPDLSHLLLLFIITIIIIITICNNNNNDTNHTI